MDKLKLVSRSWSKKTWERYLTSLEKRQGEYLTAQSGDLHYEGRLDVAGFLYESKIGFGDYGPKASAEGLEETLSRAMQCLTAREWQVIKAIFYDGLTQAQTPIHLDMKKQRVSFLKGMPSRNFENGSS